jgi:hypothetical protein
MWSFGRRDEVSPTHQQPQTQTNVLKKSGKQQLKQPYSLCSSRSGRSNKNASLNIEEMNVNETKHGIEVSLDAFKPESREPSQAMLRGPVISIKEQIRQRQRVHRTQFSVAFPAVESSNGAENNTSLDNWRPKGHRIPLLGISAAEAAYEDVLHLLQHTPVSDEHSAVHQEVEEMSAEIDALEKDQNWLQLSLRKVSDAVPNNLSPSKVMGSSVDWDVQKLLDDSSRLGSDVRKQLQQKRGNCLTMHFLNQRAKEVFLTKCGAKLPQLKNNKRRAPGDTITLGPNNCGPGGAGTSIRHMTLMSNNKGAHFGFFLSRDTGKSQSWGRVPPKLFRRIQEQGESTHVGDLVYLSTGPQGCYYAEFRSGECWWGNAVEDDDFHSIIQAWDVYRVVFGPIDAFEDERGNKRLSNSWIILGRDGRAAWKNLPSRLHYRLESRLANWAAPAEVSLGPGDSYFVRFLDGSVDYCLPAEVAQVCEYVEQNGGAITDIALHPEISHDFVIRHTEMS